MTSSLLSVLLAGAVPIGAPPLTCDSLPPSARTSCLQRELRSVQDSVQAGEYQIRLVLTAHGQAPAFDAAIAAWRAYRDRECRVMEAVYGGDGDHAGRAEALACQVALSRARLRFLRSTYGRQIP